MSTTKQFLPADVARCSGIEREPEGFEPPCVECRRRTDRHTFPLMDWRAPPEFVGGKCEARIAP